MFASSSSSSSQCGCGIHGTTTSKVVFTGITKRTELPRASNNPVNNRGWNNRGWNNRGWNNRGWPKGVKTPFYLVALAVLRRTGLAGEMVAWVHSTVIMSIIYVRELPENGRSAGTHFLRVGFYCYVAGTTYDITMT